MNAVDFLGIGDPVVDDFILLKDAKVTCSLDEESCTISMRWGDKIPYEKAERVYGVGNAANAAVAANRLGLRSALLGIVGNDENGKLIQAAHKDEGLDTNYLSIEDGVPTNYHYVLSYESERTILVRHEAYTYTFPTNLPAPKVLYLSSLAETVGDAYYNAIADFLDQHPETFFAFQPGTFQIVLGVEKLSHIYNKSSVFFCNKEESARIVKRNDLSIAQRLQGLRDLGPKIVVLTDGRNGAYAYDGSNMFKVPMYPDLREPVERTGAGDAFSSTVTAALALGKSLEEALLWGPINSMSVVQKVGAQAGLLSKEELLKYLDRAPSSYNVETYSE